MRTITTLTLATLLLAPATTVPAAPDLWIYLDEQGRFLAGLGAIGLGDVDDGEPVPDTGLDPVNLARYELTVNPCHTRLLLDLLYNPEGTTIDIPERATLTIPNEFRVELFNAQDERLLSIPVTQSRYSIPLGEPTPGPHRIDLYLLHGAAVDYTLRIRGLPNHQAACDDQIRITEVETNPPGSDWHGEWVELTNTGHFPASLAGWTLHAIHGEPATLTLPENLTIAPGERHILTFDTQFLDNTDETLQLRDPTRALHHTTPPVTDHHNDERTWQREPDTTWTFRTGTPGT